MSSTKVTSATVDEISTQTANTRYGAKATYSFKANGVWYKHGFKKPGFVKGDVIDFDYEERSYGKSVVDGSVRVSSVGVAVPNAGKPSDAPVRGTQFSGGKGVFPIPALDGQRSIVRQNALTNARELVLGLESLTGNKLTSTAAVQDAIADSVIRVARKFEAYACGDLDMIEAKKALENMTKATAETVSA